MNPCACGFLGDPELPCRCTPASIARYRQRISGPLLDRIDIRVMVARAAVGELVPALAGAAAKARAAEACAISSGILAARARREARSGAVVARLSAAQLHSCCELTRQSQRLLQRACEQLALSGRGVHRLLAVSRTIADLSDRERIEPEHLAEAVQLRRPLLA